MNIAAEFRDTASTLFDRIAVSSGDICFGNLKTIARAERFLPKRPAFLAKARASHQVARHRPTGPAAK